MHVRLPARHPARLPGKCEALALRGRVVAGAQQEGLTRKAVREGLSITSRVHFTEGSRGSACASIYIATTGVWLFLWPLCGKPTLLHAEPSHPDSQHALPARHLGKQRMQCHASGEIAHCTPAAQQASSCRARGRPTIAAGAAQAVVAAAREAAYHATSRGGVSHFRESAARGSARPRSTVHAGSRTCAWRAAR